MFNDDIVSVEQEEEHGQGYYANYWLEEDSRKLFQSISEAESALIGAEAGAYCAAPIAAEYVYHDAAQATNALFPADDYAYAYAERVNLTPVTSQQQQHVTPVTSQHVQQLSHLCPPFTEEESQLCQRKHDVKNNMKMTRKFIRFNSINIKNKFFIFLLNCFLIFKKNLLNFFFRFFY